MKSIVLSLLACVVALEAMPQPYLGLSQLGMSGLGNGYGDGMYGYGGGGYGGVGGGYGGVGGGYGGGYGGIGGGYGRGFGNGLLNQMGLGRYGLGGVSSGSGYTQGNGYGANDYNSGASGMGSQNMHTGGMGDFHDIGQHHNSLTSVTQAENTDNHDIGGGQAFDTGAQSGNGFNQFANGGSRYGNGYGSGQQSMSSFL